MKKFKRFQIFGAAVLLGAALLGSANISCGESQENPPVGAAAAPAEINHADSIYFAEPDFYNMTSDANLTILPHY